MIRELSRSSGAVLGFEITGTVSQEVEKAWIEKIDQAVEKHGKVRVLVILGEDAGWGIKAGIEDLNWVIRNMDKLERIAIVADSKVWEWLVGIDSRFAKLVGIGEKYFNISDIDAAWTWIEA